MNNNQQLREALEAAPAQDKPIYQVLQLGLNGYRVWADTSKAEYDCCDTTKRIVHASPQPAPVLTECGTNCPAGTLTQADIDKISLDSHRLWWLTEDHANAAIRKRRDEILSRMPFMSYSALCDAIENAISETEDLPPPQPPCTNEFVADGCERFPEEPK